MRSDSAFNASNRILDAVLKHNKALGLAGPVEHKDAITKENKVRLRAYFADVLETQDTYKPQSFRLLLKNLCLAKITFFG